MSITITKNGRDYAILLSPTGARQGKHTEPVTLDDLVAGLGAAREQGLGFSRVLNLEEEHDALNAAVIILKEEIATNREITVAATVMLAKVRAGKRIRRDEGDALLGRLVRDLGISLVVLD